MQTMKPSLADRACDAFERIANSRVISLSPYVAVGVVTFALGVAAASLLIVDERAEKRARAYLAATPAELPSMYPLPLEPEAQAILDLDVKTADPIGTLETAKKMTLGQAVTQYRVRVIVEGVNNETREEQ